MTFDFYQQYKDYSAIDLLKIVRRPAEYQPEAVVAATRILSERPATSEDIQFVDQYFQHLEDSAKAKKEKIDALKNKATDLLEPILHPDEKVEPRKWVNILLLVLTIQYTWLLFNTVKRLVSYFQCNYCSLDINFYAELFTLLYIPVIFFLLFKRRRWGWILLFADNLFSLILQISDSYIFFKYQNIHQGDTTSFFIPIIIRTAFVFFLWREPIAAHFRITYATKKKTALVTIAGTLLFFFIMYLLF